MSDTCSQKTVTFKCVGTKEFIKPVGAARTNDHDSMNDWVISSQLPIYKAAPVKKRVLYGRRIEADHAPELGQDYTDM